MGAPRQQFSQHTQACLAEQGFNWPQFENDASIDQTLATGQYQSLLALLENKHSLNKQAAEHLATECLMMHIRRGNSFALSALCTAMGERVAFFIAQQGVAEAAAKKLVAETFTRLFQMAQQETAIKRPMKSILYKIARQIAAEWLTTRTATASDQSRPLTHEDSHEHKQRLFMEALLPQLSRQQRDVLFMHFHKNQSSQIIAGKLKVDEATVNHILIQLQDTIETTWTELFPEY